MNAVPVVRDCPRSPPLLAKGIREDILRGRRGRMSQVTTGGVLWNRPTRRGIRHFPVVATAVALRSLSLSSQWFPIHRILNLPRLNLPKVARSLLGRRAQRIIKVVIKHTTPPPRVSVIHITRRTPPTVRLLRASLWGRH